MNTPARLSCAAATLLAASCALPARADNIAWTTWTSGTPGSPGSASGTLTTSLYGTINITYSGQTSGVLNNYPSWTPVATFEGGIVGNAPPRSGGSVQIEGGVSYNETITFSQPIEDPILAIESLGNPSTPAYFDFTTGNFTVQGTGGASSEYGGTGLVISGNSIYGEEGNGVVQFNGIYTTLNFVTPDYENFYMFTIGEDDTLTTQIPNLPISSTPAVPEPSTLSLVALALAAFPAVRRKLHRSR